MRSKAHDELLLLGERPLARDAVESLCSASTSTEP